MIAPAVKPDRDTLAWRRNASDDKAIARGCKFNLRRAAYAVWWIERHCKLYEGDRAGEPLILRGCHKCGAYGIPVPDDFDEAGEKACLDRARQYMKCVKAGHSLDWQYECTMRVFGWQTFNDMRQKWVRRFREASIWVAKKNKKALSLDTVLPTPTGWTTIGEIRTGDILFDEAGAQCQVTQVHGIDDRPDAYRVSFSNGDSVRCNAEHLWLTSALQQTVGVGGKGRKCDRRPLTRVRTTQDLFETQHRPDGACNHSVQVPGALRIDAEQLPIDPYVFGVWLGDGDSDVARVTCHADDAPHYEREFKRRGYRFERQAASDRRESWRCKFSEIENGTPLRTVIKSMGVWKNKMIPREYLRGSESQRAELLRGLMDTDGCIDKPGKCLTIVTVKPQLRDDIAELLASLGIKFSIREQRAKIDGIDKGPCWWLQFHAFRDDIEVFALPRKLDRMRRRSCLTMRARSDTIQITKVEKIAPVPMRCITVGSPSGMFRCGRTMLPTHNSPTMAAWGMYLLIGDDEPGQKVFLCAKDGMQVRANGARHCVEMVRQSPELSPPVCTVNKVEMRITHEPSRSIMTPLSSSNERTTKSKEGLNGSVLVDETHVVDREYMNRISRAGKSRTEPLHAEFSTAGDDPDSYGKERFDLAERVILGTEEVQSLFAAIYAAPQDLKDSDLDKDPLKYGRMANPAMGHTIDPVEFMDDYRKSRKSPAQLAEFKMYCLDIWQNAAAPWLNMQGWNKGLRPLKLEDFEGHQCWSALDLASVKDFAALSLAFPEPDDSFALFWWFWLPEDTAEAIQHLIPIQQWKADPRCNLILTPGARTDYGYIRSHFRELHKRFEINELAYDDWNAEQVTQEIEQGVRDKNDQVVEEGTGVPRLNFSQGIKAFNEPTKRFEACVIDGKILHDGNPLATWMAGNATIKPDQNGNYKPIKPRQGVKKIDGIITAVMSYWRAVGSGAAYDHTYDVYGSLSL